MIRDVLFQGVTAPLRLDGAETIPPLLSSIALGWPFRLTEANLEEAPFFSITAIPGETKLRCASHVEDRLPHDWDPVNAVCDALASLATALPLSDPRLICLHAAGVEMAGRLVMFPNIRRAGKSTLSAALARAGHRVFSDDVVPLTFPSDSVPQAQAMGLALRLRLPLPESLPSGFSAWAQDIPGPRNGQYTYLPLPGQPTREDTLALGAVVLLDRQELPCPAQLTPVPPDAAMDALLHQNFSRDRHSGEVLEVIASALDATPVWRLSYTDLDEAVSCLQAGFSGWDGPLPQPQGLHRWFGPAVLDYVPAVIGSRVGQRAGVVEQWIGEVLYLADPEGRAIQRMDPLAAAIWEMLEEPSTLEDLAEVLADAFPGTQRERIDLDLRDLLTGLAEAGMIEVPDGALADLTEVSTVENP